MIRLLSLSLLVAGSLCAPSGGGNSTACRCRPTEPCWPSDADWQSLNKTVNGQLSRVSPLGAVCHDPAYDKDACTALLSGGASNSSIRAAAPGAGQWPNWEAWGERNQSCYIEAPRKTPCQLGRVSPYSVAAHSAEDIVAAVKFAGQHNVRLVVKNTGHDFAGRSFAPHSLQVRTRGMASIELNEDFVPEGGQASGSAVTVEAGVQLIELYKFCHEKNITVIGGYSNTVGAAGGYIQGGGHSVLSPWKGLASDHVLQYRVVTADGTHITANAHKNEDLFWALRGGGGGTFGVVTSVTLAAHPNPPLTYLSLDIVRAAADTTFWGIVERLYEHLPALNDFGLSLSTTASPQSDMPSPADGKPEAGRALYALKGFLVGGVTEEFRGALTKLEDSWRSDTDNTTLTGPANFHFNVTTFPSITALYTHSLTGTDFGGASTAVGSRLVSRDFIASPKGPAAVADVMSKLKLAPGDTVSGNVVSGGAVATNEVDSAVHPAWRRALAHMMIVRAWPAGDFVKERAVHEELTGVQVPLLKGLALEGEAMGAYLNEADGEEPEFQEAFWGDNYGRLCDIKEKWDPEGVFIVRAGVGSEKWDSEGICRKG